MPDLKDKLFKLLSQRNLSALATVTEDGRPWVRYVVTVADENLNIRFSTVLGSRKVIHIKNNPKVHLTTGVTSIETAEHYVQVQGKALIKIDQDERSAFWHESLKTYFSGPDDPRYCVCVIKPYRIEYITVTGMEAGLDPEVWQA